MESVKEYLPVIGIVVVAVILFVVVKKQTPGINSTTSYAVTQGSPPSNEIPLANLEAQYAQQKMKAETVLELLGYDLQSRALASQQALYNKTLDYQYQIAMAQARQAGQGALNNQLRGL